MTAERFITTPAESCPLCGARASGVMTRGSDDALEAEAKRGMAPCVAANAHLSDGRSWILVCAPHLAQAIRAAENEAIERAASVLDAVHQDSHDRGPYSVGAGVLAYALAREVRSLKHPEPKP